MVRMYHDNPKETGGPTTADVPEEAVGWMQRAGWYLKEEPKKENSEKPATRRAKSSNKESQA